MSEKLFQCSYLDSHGAEVLYRLTLSQETGLNIHLELEL